MRLAVYGRLTKTTDVQALNAFFAFTQAKNIRLALFQPYVEELLQAEGLTADLTNFSDRFASRADLPDCDFLLSLGGDGTLLDALRITGQRDIPIVGVNFGRLGFLTTGDQHRLVPIVEALQNGHWHIEERTLLEVHSAPQPVFSEFNLALNDLTIHKANSNEMIVVHTYINGEFLNTYWTDGLIVSTPTGSTAYSLASGGPIMMPHSHVFVITPIAPHSLTVRPVVIPDSAVVSFSIESRSGQAYVAIDSRTEAVSNHTQLAVRKSGRKARLVKVDGPGYFATLRDRLNWGLDTRN